MVNVRHHGLLLVGLGMLGAGGMMSMQPAFLPPATTSAENTEMSGHLAPFTPDPRHGPEWTLLVPYLDNVTRVLVTNDPSVRILATFAAPPAPTGDVVVTGMERYRGSDPDDVARTLVIFRVSSSRAR